MSELNGAIQEMRNMRQVYDQIGAAAEAYNTGKTELAQNITAKGVQASATEPLPELAEKVAAIAQQPIILSPSEVGDMYAKQLYGSLTTPNYWNLYEVMTALLNNTNPSEFGGILLGEYYKGYASIAFGGSGAPSAGTGGGYVFSDEFIVAQDGTVTFQIHRVDETHYWNDDLDGKCNRWVAWLFAGENHGFSISNADSCPRTIHIGRHVGVIECIVNGRISDIVVTDGNELDGFSTGSKTQNWGKSIILRNIGGGNGRMIYQPSKTEEIYISAKQLTSCIYFQGTENIGGVILESRQQTNLVSLMSGTPPVINYLIIKGGTSVNTDGTFTYGLIGAKNVIIEDVTTFVSNTESKPIFASNSLINNIYLLAVETAGGDNGGCCLCSYDGYVNRVKKLYLGYKTNDRRKSVAFRASSPLTGLNDVELKEGWKKNCSIQNITNVLTAENIALHMLNRLADNTGEATLTLTIGSTNLNRILADETYAPYVAAAQAKNWTIA